MTVAELQQVLTEGRDRRATTVVVWCPVAQAHRRIDATTTKETR